MRLLFLLLVFAAGAVRPAPGQRAPGPPPTDTLHAAPVPLARFEAARAVAVDPAGVVYVVDAGRDVISVLAPDGRLARLGGPGTGPGRFDAPADIAPTNGLVLVVADAGNGRIQRFSRDFLHLASVPIGRDEDGQSYGRDPGAALGSGRPVAVAVATTDEAFAVDAARGVVVKWDAAGRFERTIGGYDAGAGALAEPVALALGPGGAVYVADRGRGALLVYDRYGGFERALGDGLLSDVRAVTAGRGEVWAVLPHRLVAFDARGRLTRTVHVEAPGALVDAAVTDGGILLLTEQGLYRSAE